MWSYDLVNIGCPVLTPVPIPPTKYETETPESLIENKEDPSVVNIFPNPTSEMIKVDLTSF